MPDSHTVKLIMKEHLDTGFKNLVSETDRGCQSMNNLELRIL